MPISFSSLDKIVIEAKNGLGKPPGLTFLTLKRIENLEMLLLLC